MKKIILGLLLVLSSYGQNTGQNVVNAVVLNTTTRSTSFTGTTSALQNVGQSSHMLTVTIGAVTGGANYLVTLTMQGSSNCDASGTGTYFNIGPSFTQSTAVTTANTAYQALGYGTFSCIRATYSLTISGASVTLGIGYVGISTPSLVNSDQNSYTSPSKNNSFELVADGAFHGFLVPNGVQFALYGYNISVGATGAGTILFGCSHDITTIPNPIQEWLLATNTLINVVVPTGLRNYGQCVSNDYYGYIVTTGILATHSSMSITYRFE